MGIIKKTRTLFFTTSPRSPYKAIPEIQLLISKYEGEVWRGNEKLQTCFARDLGDSESFRGRSSKKYTSFSARDRITRMPQGLGFVDLEPVIELTEPGRAFIYGQRPNEIFLRQLLKFQIPSAYLRESARIKGTFWGRPYLEMIRLIREMEYITPDEFKVFALQLTDYRDFEVVRDKIQEFREEKSSHKGAYKKFLDERFTSEIENIYQYEISRNEFATRESQERDKNRFIRTIKRNMRDYADACFRYLRYTDMFISDGRTIKVAPDKKEEIDFILSTVEREPVFLDDDAKYKEYLFDAHEPVLYSDNRLNIEDVLMKRYSFTRRELSGKSIDELKDMRESLIAKRRNEIISEQRKQLKSYALYQEVIDTYNEIICDGLYDAPLFLEWNTWRAMTMLNGGKITGNFKVDDMGRPVSTARGNLPDIECEYDEYVLSVEVTMQKGQRQYETEAEPITRHYAQLQERTGKPAYCLFVAPSINKASWAHFFGLNQIKNIAAYGGKPRIVPLELDQFMRLIESSYAYPKTPGPKDVKALLQSVIDEVDSSKDEDDWKKRIEQCVNGWLR